MTTDERLEGLAKLGKYVNAIDEVELDGLLLKVKNENPWFTPGSVNLALEGIKGDLADHRIEHVLDFAREHREAPPFVRRLFEHRAEGQHLTEHRCGFGERERRRRHECALRSGEDLVHPVSELVR